MDARLFAPQPMDLKRDVLAKPSGTRQPRRQLAVEPAAMAAE